MSIDRVLKSRIDMAFIVLGIILVIIWPTYLHFKPIWEQRNALNRAQYAEGWLGGYKSDLAVDFCLYRDHPDQKETKWSYRDGYNRGYLCFWKEKLKATIRIYEAQGTEENFNKGKLLFEGTAEKSGKYLDESTDTWIKNYILVPMSLVKGVHLKIFEKCKKRGIFEPRCWNTQPIILDVKVEKPNHQLMNFTEFYHELPILKEPYYDKYVFSKAIPIKSG